MSILQSRARPPTTVTSTLPIDLVELPRRADLGSRPLAANRQAHGVSPTPVGTDIPQPLDVILDYFPRIVLDRHRGQLGRQRRDRPLWQHAHLRPRVDAVLGEDSFRYLRADSVEGL